MRVYRIALFIFITQLFAGLLQIDALSMGFSKNPLNVSAVSSSDVQEAENMKNSIMPQESASETDAISGALGWFYRQITNAAQALFNVANPLFKAICWIPIMLVAAGVPHVYAWALFSIISVLEAIGFIEFIAGRDIER